MKDKLRTHYRNLQVTENASDEVIKGAYKFLTQKYHPDKNPGEEERCKRILQVISKAYEVLSNPESRRMHDEWIEQQRSSAHEEKESINGSKPNVILLYHNLGLTKINFNLQEYL